jgi:hypothetical protein
MILHLHVLYSRFRTLTDSVFFMSKHVKLHRILKKFRIHYHRPFTVNIKSQHVSNYRAYKDEAFCFQVIRAVTRLVYTFICVREVTVDCIFYLS